MYYSTIGIMVKGGTDVKVLKIDRSLWDAAQPGFIRFKGFCPLPAGGSRGCGIARPAMSV